MAETVLDFTLASITGEETPLARYRGSVLLIVNVASRCGFTPQYQGLQALYEKYKARGFAILGFPANDFLWQEPGTDGEIKTFCSLTYGVTFPLFSKIHVRGRHQHPLYRFLTDRKTNPDFGGRITWNFNKFLVGRDGRIVNRFPTRMDPGDPRIHEAVEKALAEEAPVAAGDADTGGKP